MYPCCRQQKEDWRHIIKCKAPSRSEWRQAAIKAIDSKCESLLTQPEIRTVLINAITAWSTWEEENQDPPFAIIPPQASTPQIQRLITRQNDIGWHQLFLGRFSNNWSEIQEDHYAKMINTKAGKQRTGQRWQQAITNEILAQWFQVWSMRNKDLHGDNESARARADREEVERTLRDLYDLREQQMEPSVQKLLCQEITDHFAEPLWYNTNWLATHGPLVKQSIKRAKKKAIQGVRSIRQYSKPR